jgi:hypothetical protein
VLPWRLTAILRRTLCKEVTCMCWEKADRWEELEREELERREEELQRLIADEKEREPAPTEEREPELISR